MNSGAGTSGHGGADRQGADLAGLLADDILARQRMDVEKIESMGFLTAGSAFVEVCLLKGKLSQDEMKGTRLLSGPDGVALRAALDKLGYARDERAALSTVVRSGSQWVPADSQDLAWAVEVLDPEVVIATDDEAAEAICQAWNVDEPAAGVVEHARGRRFINLGGFADALGDSASKQLMWARLKQVRPLGDPL